MTTVSLVPSKTAYAEGETMVFRVLYSGLAAATPPSSATGTADIDAVLSDGATMHATSATVTVTRPGTPAVTVSTETATFRGRPLTRQPDGTFTGTATVS